MTYDTDNTTLFCCLGHSSISETDADFCNVSGRGIDASHHTLVVSLKENGDERKCLDGDVELRRRQPFPECFETHSQRRVLSLD